ncbi:MAG TPA: DUF3309 family protein [Anaerolineae bacterium]|nr:DUF3309 family protein [Anaerolineae bacterium]
MFNTIVMLGLFASVPATLPVWPYSRRWGYSLSVVLGFLVSVLLILSAVDVNF